MIPPNNILNIPQNINNRANPQLNNIIPQPNPFIADRLQGGNLQINPINNPMYVPNNINRNIVRRGPNNNNNNNNNNNRNNNNRRNNNNNRNNHPRANNRNVNNNHNVNINNNRNVNNNNINENNNNNVNMFQNNIDQFINNDEFARDIYRFGLKESIKTSDYSISKKDVQLAVYKDNHIADRMIKEKVHEAAYIYENGINSIQVDIDQSQVSIFIPDRYHHNSNNIDIRVDNVFKKIMLHYHPLVIYQDKIANLLYIDNPSYKTKKSKDKDPEDVDISNKYLYFSYSYTINSVSTKNKKIGVSKKVYDYYVGEGYSCFFCVKSPNLHDDHASFRRGDELLMFKILQTKYVGLERHALGSNLMRCQDIGGRYYLHAMDGFDKIRIDKYKYGSCVADTLIHDQFFEPNNFHADEDCVITMTDVQYYVWNLSNIYKPQKNNNFQDNINHTRCIMSIFHIYTNKKGIYRYGPMTVEIYYNRVIINNNESFQVINEDVNNDEYDHFIDDRFDENDEIKYYIVPYVRVIVDNNPYKYEHPFPIIDGNVISIENINKIYEYNGVYCTNIINCRPLTPFDFYITTESTYSENGQLNLNINRNIKYILYEEEKVEDMPENITINNLEDDILSLFNLKSYQLLNDGFYNNTYFIKDNYAIINNNLCEIDYKYDESRGGVIKLTNKNIKKSMPLGYLNACVNCYRRIEITEQSIVTAKNIILKTAESEKWKPMLDINTATDYAILAAYIVTKINNKIKLNFKILNENNNIINENIDKKYKILNIKHKVKKYINIVDDFINSDLAEEAVNTFDDSLNAELYTRVKKSRPYKILNFFIIIHMNILLFYYNLMWTIRLGLNKINFLTGDYSEEYNEMYSKIIKDTKNMSFDPKDFIKNKFREFKQTFSNLKNFDNSDYRRNFIQGIKDGVRDFRKMYDFRFKQNIIYTMQDIFEMIPSLQTLVIVYSTIILFIILICIILVMTCYNSIMDLVLMRDTAGLVLYLIATTLWVFLLWVRINSGQGDTFMPLIIILLLLYFPVAINRVYTYTFSDNIYINKGITDAFNTFLNTNIPNINNINVEWLFVDDNISILNNMKYFVKEYIICGLMQVFCWILSKLIYSTLFIVYTYEYFWDWYNNLILDPDGYIVAMLHHYSIHKTFFICLNIGNWIIYFLIYKKYNKITRTTLFLYSVYHYLYSSVINYDSEFFNRFVLIINRIFSLLAIKNIIFNNSSLIYIHFLCMIPSVFGANIFVTSSCSPNNTTEMFMFLNIMYKYFHNKKELTQEEEKTILEHYSKESLGKYEIRKIPKSSEFYCDFDPSKDKEPLSNIAPQINGYCVYNNMPLKIHKCPLDECEAVYRQVQSAITYNKRIAKQYIKYSQKWIRDMVNNYFAENRNYKMTLIEYFTKLGSKRKEYMDAMKEYNDGKVMDYNYNMHPKSDEKIYVNWNKLKAKSRNISAQKSMCKLLMGMVCEVGMKILHNQPWAGPGENYINKSNKFLGWIDQLDPRSGVLCCDGSSFDSTQHELFIEQIDSYFLKLIFEHCFHLDKYFNLQDVLKVISQTNFTIYSKYFAFKMLGTQLSGRMNTCLCNTLRSASYIKFIIYKLEKYYHKKLDFTNIYYEVTGDDQIIFINYAYKDMYIKMAYKYVYYKEDVNISHGLGQVCKIFDYYENITGAEYLSCLILYSVENHKLTLCRKPERFFQLIPFTFRNNFININKYNIWKKILCYEVGYSVMVSCKNIPLYYKIGEHMCKLGVPLASINLLSKQVHKKTAKKIMRDINRIKKEMSYKIFCESKDTYSFEKEFNDLLYDLYNIDKEDIDELLDKYSKTTSVDDDIQCEFIDKLYNYILPKNYLSVYNTINSSGDYVHRIVNGKKYEFEIIPKTNDIVNDIVL